MAKRVGLDYFRKRGLLPFQAHFAVEFLEHEDKRFWELVLPVGTGKTRMTAALISHKFEEDPKKRFLVLAPAPLVSHWEYELKSAKLPCAPFVVDRKAYLELESSVSIGERPWPIPTVIVMSIDLAKREDMATNLCNTAWDLIVFDESHLLAGGRRRKLFNRFRESGSARRALLLTHLAPQSIGDAATKVIRSEVLDWDERPVYAPFKGRLLRVPYRRTDQEIDFLKELQEFTTRLAKKDRYGMLQESTLLRAASSSVFTIERVLRRLQDVWRPMRNKMAHGLSWTDEDIEKAQHFWSVSTDEARGELELLDGITIHPPEFLELYLLLDSLLNQIEEMATDSKLDALVSHISESVPMENVPYLCIWCSFISTVDYLDSSLHDLCRRVYSLTSTLDLSYRKDSLEAFRKEGGILILTDASSEGVVLSHVQECINYDLPLNISGLEQRLGRFLRIDRKADFRMVLMNDQNNTLSWEEKILGAIGEQISFYGPET
jgi:hypothetical protein